jgi:hypothetical protein
MHASADQGMAPALRHASQVCVCGVLLLLASYHAAGIGDEDACFGVFAVVCVWVGGVCMRAASVIGS